MDGTRADGRPGIIARGSRKRKHGIAGAATRIGVQSGVRRPALIRRSPTSRITANGARAPCSSGVRRNRGFDLARASPVDGSPDGQDQPDRTQDDPSGSLLGDLLGVIGEILGRDRSWDRITELGKLGEITRGPQRDLGNTRTPAAVQATPGAGWKADLAVVAADFEIGTVHTPVANRRWSRPVQGTPAAGTGAAGLRWLPPWRPARWRDDRDCGRCRKGGRKRGPPGRSRWEPSPPGSRESLRRVRRSSLR
jgi:hypothetical protein